MDTNGLSNHVTTISGCWFGTFFLTFHILGMSSSQLTDLYFSERLKPQTIMINQLIISMVATWIILPVGHWLATKVFRGVGIPPTRYPIDCLLRISLLYPILTVGGAQPTQPRDPAESS